MFTVDLLGKQKYTWLILKTNESSPVVSYVISKYISKKKKFQKKLFATVCHNVEIMPYVWSGLPEQYMIRFKIWMLKL